MSDIHSTQGVITQFLIHPRLRIARHILLILTLGVISFNQTFVAFSNHSELSDAQLYGIGTSTLILYLLLVYTNIFVLVPRFLLQRKYTFYILSVSCSIFLFLILQILKEYMISEYIELPSLRSSYLNIVTVLDIFSNFFLNLIAITGISFTILMKHWLTDGSRVSLLEKQQVQQQVDDLKEQVNPELLFKTLNRSAALSKFEPDKATEMLYKLSELLRYQLYDCAREKVLLTSVIRFLENYLSLEQLYSHKFTYSLAVQGQTSGVFVEPLLFIPFIKEMISRIYESEQSGKLEVTFIIENQSILFTCRTKGIRSPGRKDFSGIRHRLDILYKDDYLLDVSEGEDAEVSIRFELNLK